LQRELSAYHVTLAHVHAPAAISMRK
jgi:hypothetical protein